MRSKLAFTRNLLNCNNDFKRKITRRSNFAASRLSAMWYWHCLVDVSYTVGWVIGLYHEHCAASSTRNGRLHSLRECWLRSFSQSTWWHWNYGTYSLIFLTKFEFGVFYRARLCYSGIYRRRVSVFIAWV